MKKHALIFAALAAVAFSAHGQDVNSDLAEWNVITLANLQMVNGDIQGLSYIGGNVTVPNAFNVGTGGGIPQSTISLAVGGSITGGVNLSVNGGSVVAGGSISDHLNMNSGGSQSANSPGLLPASPVSTVVSASQYWSGLSANSSTAVNGADQLNFNCLAGSSLAVFNLTASQLFSSGYQGFNLNPDGATTEVIINVSGTSVNWAPGSSFFTQFNTPTWDARVLFNFYNATSVSLSGQLGGYIVAPNASVTLASSLTGGIMCSNLTAEGEIDLATAGSSTTAWRGTVPVPEPSAIALAGLGGLGLIFLRRR